MEYKVFSWEFVAKLDMVTELNAAKSRMLPAGWVAVSHTLTPLAPLADTTLITGRVFITVLAQGPAAEDQQPSGQ